MSGLRRVPTGNGSCQPVYRRNAVERAFELAESGRIKTVRELRQKLAQEGFGTGDLEGRALVRQLTAKMNAAKSNNGSP